MLQNCNRVVSIALLLLVSSAAGVAEAPGAATYKAKCLMCHGATGLGDTGPGKALKASSFNTPEVMNKSDADLAAVIKKGKNNMPSFNGSLNDAKIKDVLVYIHTLQTK